MMNFQKMMQQAQQMQFKLQEMQEKLADIEVEGEAGGGMVKVRMTCKGEILSIDINPNLINPAEKEILEDLVVAALNNAGENKEQRVASETQAMMKALGLPEGGKLPF